MSLKVLDPGPLTTVQDAGRTGYAAKGYRVSGAADSYAYRVGNMLIGNAPGAAVLECMLFWGIWARRSIRCGYLPRMSDASLSDGVQCLRRCPYLRRTARRAY